MGGISSIHPLITHPWKGGGGVDGFAEGREERGNVFWGGFFGCTFCVCESVTECLSRARLREELSVCPSHSLQMTSEPQCDIRCRVTNQQLCHVFTNPALYVIAVT